MARDGYFWRCECASPRLLPLGSPTLLTALVWSLSSLTTGLRLDEDNDWESSVRPPGAYARSNVDDFGLPGSLSDSFSLAETSRFRGAYDTPPSEGVPQGELEAVGEAVRLRRIADDAVKAVKQAKFLKEEAQALVKAAEEKDKIQGLTPEQQRLHVDAQKQVLAKREAAYREKLQLAAQARMDADTFAKEAEDMAAKETARRIAAMKAEIALKAVASAAIGQATTKAPSEMVTNSMKTGAAELDCAAGFDVCKTEWSDYKIKWCCQNRMVCCRLGGSILGQNPPSTLLGGSLQAGSQQASAKAWRTAAAPPNSSVPSQSTVVLASGTTTSPPSTPGSSSLVGTPSTTLAVGSAVNGTSDVATTLQPMAAVSSSNASATVTSQPPARTVTTSVVVASSSAITTSTSSSPRSTTAGSAASPSTTMPNTSSATVRPAAGTTTTRYAAVSGPVSASDPKAPPSSSTTTSRPPLVNASSGVASEPGRRMVTRVGNTTAADAAAAGGQPNLSRSSNAAVAAGSMSPAAIDGESQNLTGRPAASDNAVRVRNFDEVSSAAVVPPISTQRSTVPQPAGTAGKSATAATEAESTKTAATEAAVREILGSSANSSSVGNAATLAAKIINDPVVRAALDAAVNGSKEGRESEDSTAAKVSVGEAVESTEEAAEDRLLTALARSRRRRRPSGKDSKDAAVDREDSQASSASGKAVFREDKGDEPERSVSGKAVFREDKGDEPDRLVSGKAVFREDKGDEPDRLVSGKAVFREDKGDEPDRSASGKAVFREDKGEESDRQRSYDDDANDSNAALASTTSAAPLPPRQRLLPPSPDVECLGWSPSTGRYQGQGGHCAHWSGKGKGRWCFVDRDYDGPGREFLKPSVEYKGKAVVPCFAADTKREEQAKQEAAKAQDAAAKAVEVAKAAKRAADAAASAASLRREASAGAAEAAKMLSGSFAAPKSVPLPPMPKTMDATASAAAAAALAAQQALSRDPAAAAAATAAAKGMLLPGQLPAAATAMQPAPFGVAAGQVAAAAWPGMQTPMLAGAAGGVVGQQPRMMPAASSILPAATGAIMGNIARAVPASPLSAAGSALLPAAAASGLSAAVAGQAMSRTPGRLQRLPKPSELRCLGWAPSFGPLQGKGGSCAHWGRDVRWCFVAARYKGPGHEFARESFVYPGKFFAPCGNAKAPRPEGSDEILAAATTTTTTEDAEHPRACSGWSPSYGILKAKGGTCGRWEWTMPWCFVEGTYEGAGAEFLFPSTVYPGKFFAPCAVPGPALSPVEVAAASADVVPQEPETRECSGWAPRDGPQQRAGAYCDTWGLAMRWCFVSGGYIGPGREFVTPSKQYPGKFFVPCPDANNMSQPVEAAPPLVVATTTATTTTSTATATTTTTTGKKATTATTAASGKKATKSAAKTTTTAKASAKSSSTTAASSTMEAAAGETTTTATSKSPTTSSMSPTTATTTGEASSLASTASTTTSTTGASGALLQAVTCSGWSPSTGKYKGTGGSCQKWGWAVPWCYVASDYSGVGHEFLVVSDEYAGKQYVPCGDWLSSAHGPST
eukprot:TRINITY_DN4627_c0_g1_i1.p1 TRINITY_DN4627_c0_g1~~TRINITY_DN4627_c0_g1_i1.p1  ORF type:complete len:1576 (-),score=399.78 TRINITY_DN4627_c0_g1_i1:86-4744(-)